MAVTIVALEKYTLRPKPRLVLATGGLEKFEGWDVDEEWWATCRQSPQSQNHQPHHELARRRR